MTITFSEARHAAATLALACAPAIATPLAGTVRDDAGQPVPGALVVAADNSDRNDPNGAPHRWITTSDAAGKFVFEAFPAGSCRATANAGAAGVGQANCDAGDAAITVRQAGASASGRVVRTATASGAADDVVLVTLARTNDEAPVVYGTRVEGDAWSIALPAGAWSARAVTLAQASSVTYFVLPGRTARISLDLVHPHGTQPALARELHAMAVKDQEVRQAFVAAVKQDEETYKPVQRVDDANLARLKQIVRQHGWPTAALVGSAGVGDAWLLAQHAPGDFIAKALPPLRQAADRGEIAWSKVALMIDRDLMDRDEPQIYGSQLRMVDGHFAPWTIEDQAHVDERRAQVGLGPLAEYVASFDKR